MILTSLRLAARRLRRKTGYVALNVIGLAIGIATCAVLLLFVRHETSYDAYQEHAERIGLLVAQTERGGELRPIVHLPTPLAHDVLETFSAVEHAIRVRTLSTLGYRIGGEAGLLEEASAYADPEVFQVFSFPLLAGDPATALADPDAVVLDEDLARRLFGEPAEAALGQAFELGGSLTRVTGVMARVPATSHWRPRLLMPLARGEGLVGAGMNPYHVFAHRIYLLFHEGHDPQAVMARAPEALASRLEGTTLDEAEFGVQPVRRIHLYGESPWGTVDTSFTLQEISRLARLQVFSIVAVLILLLAGVNYVNLATAYGMRHAREVGVRKTLGARRHQVARLFLTEATLMAALAGVLALILVPLALPFFNEAVQTELTFSPFRQPVLVAALLGLALGVGVLAGAYPALVLSRPSPATVFRSNLPAGLGGRGVRQGLVVFQFTVSVALVICTLVMGRQLAFMQTERLGLEPEQVLVVELRWASDQNPHPALEDRLRQHPAVVQSAVATFYPGSGAGGFSSFRPPGMPADAPPVFVYDTEASATFREVLGLELLAGRDLPPGPYPEQNPPVLINETAAAEMGWTPEEAIGRGFPFPDSGPVSGVVRDFRYGSMREEIRPARVRPLSEDAWASVLLVRFHPGSTREVVAAVQDAWAAAAPGAPLRTHFLDERFAQLYSAERRLAGLFSTFAGLAVLVGCLGLFGLAAFTAQARTKEIGIRKALGATLSGLLVLLTGDFLKLVAVAFVLATPLAYWAMSHWLEGFVYRVTLGPGVFLAAGGLALAVALLTVSYHALRAASTDPVRALRDE